MSDSSTSSATPSTRNPNTGLDDTVRERVEQLDHQTTLEWGGQWNNGTPSVRSLDINTRHIEKTEVRSPEDGRAAFRRYRDFFDYVLSERDADADRAVLLPCGKQKPIGSSTIHQKKLDALAQAGLGPDDVDIVIISEPCTVIPHDMRLTLPAVNYDFPPDFAEQGTAPEVFDVFTDRLAEWLDARDYETVYSYLVKRHQNKLDAAMEKAESPPEMVEVPGASLNRKSESYSGDLFKSVEDIAVKLEFVKAFRDGSTQSGEDIGEYDEWVVEFYRERLAG